MNYGKHLFHVIDLHENLITLLTNLSSEISCGVFFRVDPVSLRQVSSGISVITFMFQL